jgi:hypothetical protein
MYCSGFKSMTLQIDLAQVNWLYVAILAVFVFVADVIGNLLASSRWMAATLTAVFAAIFVFWSYYPPFQRR